MRARVRLLIELGVHEALRGVRKQSVYTTPVAASRRLIVCTGAGVCLMWSIRTSRGSATPATTHASSQTCTQKGMRARETDTKPLIIFPLDESNQDEEIPSIINNRG